MGQLQPSRESMRSVSFEASWSRDADKGKTSIPGNAFWILRNFSARPSNEGLPVKDDDKLDGGNVDVGDEDDDDGSDNELDGQDDELNADDLLQDSPTLEENVSYVIVQYEGSFFPGIVKKIGKTEIKV